MAVSVCHQRDPQGDPARRRQRDERTRAPACQRQRMMGVRTSQPSNVRERGGECARSVVACVWGRVARSVVALFVASRAVGACERGCGRAVCCFVVVVMPGSVGAAEEVAWWV